MECILYMSEKKIKIKKNKKIHLLSNVRLSHYHFVCDRTFLWKRQLCQYFYTTIHASPGLMILNAYIMRPFKCLFSWPVLCRHFCLDHVCPYWGLFLYFVLLCCLSFPPCCMFEFFNISFICLCLIVGGVDLVIWVHKCMDKCPWQYHYTFNIYWRNKLKCYQTPNNILTLLKPRKKEQAKHKKHKKIKLIRNLYVVCILFVTIKICFTIKSYKKNKNKITIPQKPKGTLTKEKEKEHGLQ